MTVLAQPVVPVHLKPIVDMSVNRQREATNDLIKGFTILAEVTNPNDPTGALIAAADTILQRHVAEHKVPEEYPADWAKLRALYVTLEKTEHTRDRRRETLSLALGNPDDFQYGLLKKLSDYFGVTYYEATCARFHSLEHGAGMPTPQFSYARQGLPVNATNFLSNFTVHDAVVLKMPGRATGENTERFKRYLSLRAGYRLLEQMRAEHNAQNPDDFIKSISYGKYVEAMSDKGYSRMRCYTGVCECCHSNGHVNWESLLTLFSEVRASFLELKAPDTLWPEHLERTSEDFTRRIRVLREYYKFEFKTHLNHHTTEASHNILLALSHPDVSSPFHVDLSHMVWVQQCMHCADRNFVITDIEGGIQSLLSFVQPPRPPPAPSPSPAVEQLNSLSARLSVINKRISKLIGHHIRDANAEKYQAEKKAGLTQKEPSADFGEFAS